MDELPRVSKIVFALMVGVCGSFLVGGVGSTTPVQAIAPAVRNYRESHESEIIAELSNFLSVPNVASDDINIRKNAMTLINMMKQRGIQARALEGNGPPAVFGELKTLGATRTIAFYAHYDGQPIDASQWATNPYKPSLRNGPIEAGGTLIAFPKPGERFDPEWRLYARSAADDKAPIVALLVALDALRAAKIPLRSNLKFFFEGEEEAGSPHLEELLKKNAELLSADVWLAADGPVHQTRRPLISFGARGIVTADITVYGPNHPLHSGHYGNWAPNPAMQLAKLLASMKDENGRVLVEGFYDDVEPLGDEEKRALKAVPSIDAELRREYGLARTEGSNRTLAELINEPSLNIDGLRSEDVGHKARTVIPAEATATIDMRLVKGIDPHRQLERLIAHIKKQGYIVCSEEPDPEMRAKYPLIARITNVDSYPASRTSMALPIAKRIVRAIEQAVGQEPILLPTEGGSGPVAIFDAVTHTPQIGVPIVNHDNNQHGPNENLRLQNLWDGIEMFAALMTTELA